MELDAIKSNALDLELEFQWLSKVIETILKPYLGEESDVEDIYSIPPPNLEDQSMYANFIKHYEVNFAERLTMLLALAPHIKPQLLDIFFARNSDYERGFTEFGGIMGKSHGGFIPTGETALFILAGKDLDLLFSLHQLFDRDHFFARHAILKLAAVPESEPFLCGALNLSSEIIDYFSTGNVRKPDFSSNFPAHHITTELEWNDLILD